MADTSRTMPPGWVWSTVAGVGSVRLGRQRSPEKQTGRFPTKYLRAANIGPNGIDVSDVLEMDFTPSERRIFELRFGDIVLAEASGSAAQVGRSALWQDELPGCCFQNTIIRFRSHAVVPRYALIVFQHYAIAGTFAQASRGVGIQHLGASRFADLDFPLPPLTEQERIADVTETRRQELCEAEASLRSALAHIDEQTAEILAAAASGQLVEREAEIAEREGRSFDHPARALQRDTDASSTPLLDGLQERGSVIDGAARAAPPGWIWVRIDQAGEVSLGKMLEPRRHHGSNMRPYLRVANVLEDRIDVTDVKLMHFEPQELDAYELHHGDILLNEGQSPELVGRPAMYRDELPTACFQKTLLRFRAFPAVEPEFALLVFRHYLHAGEFRNVAQWSTNIAHLTRRRFAAMPFPVPPLAEQRRIVVEARKRLDDSRVQRVAVATSLTRLPAMTAELLFAAVSGKLARQDPNDEDAADLLSRLGEPLIEDTTMVSPDENKEGAIDDQAIAPDMLTPPSLVDVLRAAGRPMSLPDLCNAAGYDRHQTADIERFYIALHAELGKSLRKVGDFVENADLEVIDHASR